MRAKDNYENLRNIIKSNDDIFQMVSDTLYNEFNIQDTNLAAYCTYFLVMFGGINDKNNRTE